ncbi:MAG: serine hydrolase [Gemmatimonadetes bacterium]|nr:serine hydrolase [Gemmatimonadota bacterium]
MKKHAAGLGIALLLGLQPAYAQRRPASSPPQAAAPYYPERFEWQHRTAAQVGMDSATLVETVKTAQERETKATTDLAMEQALTFGRAPYGDAIGPLKERGPASGLVMRHGYIVAEWGDPQRVDMTHSVTKTFLSTVVGLAWQRGLIHDVTDHARDYLPTSDLFTSEHNAPITLEHLLRQTSDWQGTLWGKPDWADRPEGDRPADYPNRRLWEPGTHYKYNDVRVNVLALLMLNVWRRPLPQVLREEIMEPIGASNTWRWEGYQNSWVELDGQRMQSVSGGGHWGGGMFINTYDMARFGLLFLRNGRWKDHQLIAEKWIAMARSPGPANAEYGYANWFLNTGKKPLPSAPESSVTFRGNGQNIIYIDWDNDLVAVIRWIEGGPALNEVIGKLLAGLRPSAGPAAAKTRLSRLVGEH